MTELCKPFDEKMRKTIEVVKGDFASVRAGRANAGVLDRIQVEYYGTPTPKQQVARISNPHPPPKAKQPRDPTQERRVELTKQVRKYGENGKVAIRNIRRDAMESFKDKKKKSEITEDQFKDYEQEMQDITDKRCKEIDALTAEKEKELMAV